LARARTQGFTLLEMMLVVVIVGIIAAIAVPAWRQIQSDFRAKGAARIVANAFDYARSQAILTEHNEIVFVSTGPATDPCGNALPGPIVILDDGAPGPGNNCCINPGEDTVALPNDPARAMAGLSWGVSFAGAKVPTDIGAGNFTTGSTFSDPAGVQTQWVLFRPDGVPVAFTAACVLGQVGSGGGGVYLTNGAGGASGRDYAVILSPLGVARVHSFDRASGAWTN
jgi:prepilin-type N-terminal cleavage/methylation domain-containing protein